MEFAGLVLHILLKEDEIVQVQGAFEVRLRDGPVFQGGHAQDASPTGSRESSGFSARPGAPPGVWPTCPGGV
ncbi:hypothetical protein GCM10010232_09220 [Streptomyces amakusaensis]